MENKETLYIEITKCSSPGFWYNDKIGFNYEVYRQKNTNYYEKTQNYYVVKHDDKIELRINVDDCIIATRRLKILKLKNKLNEIS